MAAREEGGQGGSQKSQKGEKKGQQHECPSLRDCAHCGAAEGSIDGAPTHRACGRCGLAFYCGKPCQTAHWNRKIHLRSVVPPPSSRRLKGVRESTLSVGKSRARNPTVLIIKGVRESTLSVGKSRF